MRRTIPDKDATTAVYSDEELASFLADEGDWRRGSALALETLASDNAMIGILSAGGTSANGVFAANSLLNRAAKLREQADTADAETGGLFDISEWVVDDFSARERLANEVLRSLP